MLGLALEPRVGGALIAAGGWRLIFLVNVPVGAAGVVAGLYVISRARHLRQRAPLDWARLALVVPVAVVLVGFGPFTPANNASILSAVPREQSGEASGVVNVTRGIGTALGPALTGLVFALGGGDGPTASGVVAGYHDAAATLAVAAGAAAFVAWARGTARSAASPAEAGVQAS